MGMAVWGVGTGQRAMTASTCSSPNVAYGSNPALGALLRHVRLAAVSSLQLNVATGRISADFVAKLGGRRLARNNRIGGKQFLNRCCALIAVLESMLPARALKIVLQQNRPGGPPSALPGRAGFEAGMARAKGKRIGRPAIDADLREQLAVRVAEVGAYQAARELGVDRKTAMKYANA